MLPLSSALRYIVRLRSNGFDVVVTELVRVPVSCQLVRIFICCVAAIRSASLVCFRIVRRCWHGSALELQGGIAWFCFTCVGADCGVCTDAILCAIGLLLFRLESIGPTDSAPK